MHGGGFYHPQKYLVAPKALPEHLHWFYWESYTHLADRLRAVHGAVPVQRRHLPRRQDACSTGRRARPSAAALGFLAVVLARLRRDLPHARAGGQERRPARRRWRSSSFVVFAVVAGLPAVRRPRGLPAGRRDARHGDERQRLLLDHPGPAHGRSRR
ncbi:MAG: urate hydroxylase PuuD [Comamonadaceae bacterium]|nr:urate hydroxylase PuuD [Comamonadaceae bacterium]